MTLEQVKTVLEGSGLPVTYRAWLQDPDAGLPPPLPWICYVETGDTSEAADGIVYHRWREIRIELYSRDKDPASEAALEAALSAAGLFWVKTEEVYIDGESAVEIVYEIEV